MSSSTSWTRQQLLVAFRLYCQIPFGKLHSRNPTIVRYSGFIGRTPSALAMKLTNIASLDPTIVATGRKGLMGSSVADKAMWTEMQNDWEGFVVESEQAIKSVSDNGVKGYELIDESSQDEKEDYVGNDKIRLTKVRIGQAFFRSAVLSAYEYKCCITGLSVPNLLVASHIVPWRSDVKNRLNPRNGLCLSMLHDKAFDLGIITISENMTVRVSSIKEGKNDIFYTSALLDYDNKEIRLPKKFQPNAEFLDYHRARIFRHQVG